MTRRDFLATASTAGVFSLLPASASADSQAETPSQRPATPAVPAAGEPMVPGGRERLLFDFNWRFHLGNAADPTLDFDYGLDHAFAKTGDLFKPSHRSFDDSNWQAVDLPHDWAVALPFVNDPELMDRGYKPIGRKYPANSIGWYRRTFDIPASDLGRRLTLEFDGVFRDCVVALNGVYLGRNMSGYAPFQYDISDVAAYGAKNVLVVRVNATESEGWFYEGTGIYRHVWLTKTHPVHVGHWGTYVTTKVDSAAAITVRTEVFNDRDAAADVEVGAAVLDADGATVAEIAPAKASLAGWRRKEIEQTGSVAHPRLWSPEDPYIYKLVTVLRVGGAEVDRYETPFGIRTISFDPDNGFFLNGARVEIKGTCNHQDHAGVGMALPDHVQYFRVQKLKAMGSNACRTSHNPPTPEFLDACDRLGMMVMDETRMFSSSPEGLSQLGRLIRRDRNRPCVVLWSIGNEEPLQISSAGARVAASMKRLARRLDPTRPITEAMNYGWGKGLSAVVDVQGFNYGHADGIDAFHRQFPAKPCVGSETGSTVSTRGVYANDPQKGYVSAYDANAPSWAALAEQWWPVYAERKFLEGGFIWTGFDYRGEPTPYQWPCINSHFGLMDTCGFPKDLYFYYRAWWSGEPSLHLFPHWNWAGKEGKPVSVWVFSNAERVELFLNGRSLGVQPMIANRHIQWAVPYEPGVIEARAYTSGRPALTARRETTGAAAAISLAPDRNRIAADGQDVAVVAVSVTDARGRVVPVADNLVQFEISGPGRIIGVGNGDPSSHEPDKASQRRLFNGYCEVIVQATKAPGDLRLTATSAGLQSATSTIAAQAAPPRPFVP